MSSEQQIQSPAVGAYDEAIFRKHLAVRNQRGQVAKSFFMFANLLALGLLVILFVHVLNSAFGLVIVENRIDPAALASQPLADLSEPELVNILIEYQPNRIPVMIRDNLSKVPNTEFTTRLLGDVLRGEVYAEEFAELTIRELTIEQQATILSDNLSQSAIVDLVIGNVVQPTIIRSWRLFDSIFSRSEIEEIAAAEYPNDTLEFKRWMSWDFVTSSVSSSATTAGLRTALLGSFWIISVTAISALIVGVGAAIYLEEYAQDNVVNRAIEINIRNLASIPSVIYGMLGLAVFVRILGHYTSGQFLGVTDTNGRTVVSAGLTLALLILPIIIVNAQEAIRAVPDSIRQASYGLGATKRQTVFRQVFPAAIPGIMTGVILSMSRAVGETAPLLVVGASTFIGIDPNGPFSKFTVVPIQIFQWTSRPEQEFKNVAAAAIIVLLIVMILLNTTAIILRNRFSRRF